MKHPGRWSKVQRCIPFVLTTLTLTIVVACTGRAVTPAAPPMASPPTATPIAPVSPPTAAPTQAPTLSPSRAEQGETWVLKGFAVGEKAGHERGNSVMADVILLDDGTYRMYYGYSLEKVFTGDVATAKNPPSIKYAESKDGINWVVRGTVLKGDPDPKSREHIISGPRILRLPDGRYRMYYFSSQQQKEGEQPQLHIRSAISIDGINFTREGVRIEIAPYDNSTGLRLAAHGTFFIASDGTYVAIFSGHLTTEQGPGDLKIAVSKDGLMFTGYKTLYMDWHDPIVIKVAGGYRMYAAFLLDTYGTAFSPDGIHWPSQMTEISLVDAKGNRLSPRDSYVGDLGAVVLPDGKIRLYANYGSPSSIGYFEKSQLRPISQNPFGVMLPSQVVRSSQGIQVAKALGALYFRPSSIFQDQWNGTCTECDIATSVGLKLVLTVQNSGPLPTAPPSDLTAYQRTLGQVLDKYRPAILAVENEENSALFYTGTPEEYAAELKAACQVAHQKGIPCTNGGLVGALVALLVYDHYIESGQPDKAKDFVDRAFTNFKPDLRPKLNSPEAKRLISKGKALLSAYRTAGIDYVNFHWYFADTKALEEAVVFLRAQTNLPVITNEIGQQTDDPNQTTAVMGKIVDLGVPIAVWFGLDGPKARGLVNLNGSLRPTGQAFKGFIEERFAANK